MHRTWIQRAGGHADADDGVASSGRSSRHQNLRRHPIAILLKRLDPDVDHGESYESALDKHLGPSWRGQSTGEIVRRLQARWRRKANADADPAHTVGAPVTRRPRFDDPFAYGMGSEGNPPAAATAATAAAARSAGKAAGTFDLRDDHDVTEILQRAFGTPLGITIEHYTSQFIGATGDPQQWNNIVDTTKKKYYAQQKAAGNKNPRDENDFAGGLNAIADRDDMKIYIKLAAANNRMDTLLHERLHLAAQPHFNTSMVIITEGVTDYLVRQALQHERVGMGSAARQLAYVDYVKVIELLQQAIDLMDADLGKDLLLKMFFKPLSLQAALSTVFRLSDPGMSDKLRNDFIRACNKGDVGDATKALNDLITIKRKAARGQSS